MLNKILYRTSPLRFLTYAVLLYVLAITLPPLLGSLKAIPVVLFLAQAFLLAGVAKRWPQRLASVIFITIGFWVGMTYTVFTSGF
tara:strand:+ start:2674 stop:2928 length:255 start_codon:yes stop_codon:yes gene_type:complete